MKKRIFVLAFLLTACGASLHGNNAGVGAMTGSPNQSLIIKGSDTEVQMVSNLAEAYAKAHPETDISVTGGGSATGIASLLNGEITLANSSRDLKPEERQHAKDKGMDVKALIVATDGLTVVIHPSNPVRTLTIDQLGKIYLGAIKNWKEVGGPDAPITLYGRQSTSGTFSFFRDAVVKGDYSPAMHNMEGNEAIVDAVKADASGIGYVGVGYILGQSGAPRTDIAFLRLPSTSDGTPVSPLDEAAVRAGKYPIARPIYQFMPRTPSKDSLLARFLRFESSPEGVSIIKKSGFYKPTDAADAQNAAFLNSIR